MADGFVEIEFRGNKKPLEQDIKQTEQLLNKADNKFNKNGLSKLTSKLSDTTSKALTKALNLGKGLSKVLGSVVKGTLSFVANLGAGLLTAGVLLGGLAIAGFTLKKALDQAFGSSEQLKANLSYIGFVGTKMFENLLTGAINKTTNAVEGLVNALYKALVYIGYIVSAWTGINLFEGTGVEDYAKAMEDAKKSANGTSKALKNVKKELMGFDEVNRLSDNATGGTTSGAGVGVIPNLPNLEDVPIPSWVEWLSKNGDIVADILLAIASGLIAVKLGLDLVQGAGLFLVAKGIKELLEDIKKYSEDPSFKNLARIGQDIGMIITGVGMLIGLTTPLGLFLAVVGQGIAIFSAVGEQIKNIKNFLEEPTWENFVNLLTGAIRSTGVLGQVIAPVFSKMVSGSSQVKSAFESVKGTINSLKTALVQLGLWVYTKLGPYFSMGLGGIKKLIQDTFKGAVNFIIDKFNYLISKINEKLTIKIPSWVPSYGGKEWKANLKPIPRLAKGGIINNPGRGVALGTAIGGEAGREMVLPLDDNTLDRLGSAIARHQVINATIVNQMNGRTLSREIKQITNENSFSYNV